MHPTSLESLSQQRPVSLSAWVEAIALLMPLWDAMDKVVFFIKDTEARYVLANQTLLQRLACHEANELIGHTSAQLFAENQGKAYMLQDQQVLQ